jgi:hypothetical protein
VGWWTVAIPTLILGLGGVLLAFGSGDLAFDGEGDAVGAWNSETGCITANLIGWLEWRHRGEKRMRPGQKAYLARVTGLYQKK